MVPNRKSVKPNLKRTCSISYPAQDQKFDTSQFYPTFYFGQADYGTLTLCCFGRLTNKEILVLLHILQGKASGEIAADTGVSDNTIRSQRISALRKLGARTPIELATVLVTIGLQTFMDGNGELIDGKIA